VLVLENHLVVDAFSPERVRALELLSGHISVAIENSLLFEAQRRAESDSQLLADASAAFAESLDYDGILQRVAHFPLPNLADLCAIDLVVEGTIRRVAVADVDHTLESVVAEAGAGFLDIGAPHPTAQVVRTGQPVLLATIDEAILRATMREEREVKNALALGIRSALVVPLVVRGRAFGALSLGARQAERYSERDLTLAQELGRRAGTAIDNARLYAEAQSAVRVRDEFLSVASHELRTPLTSLKLVMQGLLLKAIPMTEDNLSRTFGVAARQIARLTRLIDELLNVSRIRAGRLALEVGDVDLAQVVRDATERLAEDLERAQCQVALQLTPVVGRWDKSALDQVVTNILSNAAKFGAGAPIHVTVGAVDGKARLEITDRGIGIPANRLAQIFERYERGVSARQYGGLGLGLYIAKAIVDALGGSIWATSPGTEQGATFTVELPLAVGERL
jgi:signal transduction histidine kinase